MALITESVTTITPTNYTIPVYRTFGANLFIKIYSATKMILVSNATGQEYIKNVNYPSGGFTTIAETTASDVTAFGNAYTAVQAILAAL